jgi:DNA polymerase-4
MGLTDLKKIRQADQQIMLDEFGPYWAPRLQKMAAGQLDEQIIPYYKEEKIKSASASYTLNQNTFNKNDLFKILIQLVEKVCRRLRKNNLQAKTTHYFLRFENFTHWSERKTWSGYLSDEILFFEWAKKQIEKLIFPKSVRLIGFRADKLMENNNQLPLFIKDRKKVLLTEYLDKINNAYGERTIFSGAMLDAPKLKKRAGGFKFEI